MTALQEPFRYDYVGSFLRPEKVKKAKALYEDGKIEKEELDETINEAIREVVAKQKDLGFHVITDGEFRRTYWHLDFMWGFEGVAHRHRCSSSLLFRRMWNQQENFMRQMKS